VDIGVCLFDLVEEDNAARPLLEPPGEKAIGRPEGGDRRAFR
jgi:hypothetical protein